MDVKNRIVMSSMGPTGLIEPDGRLSERAIDYYVARAQGGVGLITLGATRVSREVDAPPIPPLRSTLIADNMIYAPRLGELADDVHDYGAKVAVQLIAGHGRCLGNDLLKSGTVPLAPSELPCCADSNIMTHELTEKEIEKLVQDFGTSAGVLRSSGIDAVELNCHFGYLADEFITSLWNKRTDKYGGNLENRLRFILEIMESIKMKAGATFPIIVKVGLTHYLDGGRDIDEGLEICRRLEAAGVDALHIDAGCFESLYWGIPPTTQPPGCLVPLSEMVKRVVKIPVIAIGKLGYPELAEKVLQEGKADFIAMGRSLIADPEWANKVRGGRPEEVIPCVGDHEGCMERPFAGKITGCTVNPMTGQEKKLAISLSEKRKSVLVIGGGPAGMEAAITASLRGHDVALWDKGSTLGGNLIPASAPDFKQDYKRFLEYLSNRIEKLGVNIYLNKEATTELILKTKPEVLFLATGSMPIIPDIRGIEREKVVTAVDLLLGKKVVGESVVIIGGGMVGCETGLYLAQKGKKVTIVEIMDKVMRDMSNINRMHILALLNDHHVRVLTETQVLDISNGGIKITNKFGQAENLTADSVVLAAGAKSEIGLWETLKDKLPGVYAVGDCVKPRKLFNAVWEGFRTARLI
jgi:2-enoate reductase